MAAAMHAEIADALTYDRVQMILSDFMQNIKAQYLTSFGLGTPFPRDDGGRPRRRNRSRRGRSHFRGYQPYNQGVTRSDTSQQTPCEASRLEDGSQLQNQGQSRGLCYVISLEPAVEEVHANTLTLTNRCELIRRHLSA